MIWMKKRAKAIGLVIVAVIWVIATLLPDYTHLFNF